MKATTRRQRKLMKKFSDPSSSLLEERWQYQRRFYIWLIVITNILAFFSGFVFLIVYYQVKRAYLYAKELYDEGNEKKLLEYVKHGGTWGYQTTGSFGRFFSIYALVDMKNIEIARVLRDRLHELRFYSKLMQRPYQYPLEVLAIKLDYATPEQLISRLDGLEETPVEEKIPITKVYFVKKIPKVHNAWFLVYH